MLSLGDLAQRDGLAKPTVSIRVKHLVETHGLVVERDGQGRVKLVDVAEYDRLRAQFADPTKAQAPRPSGPPPVGAVPGESLDEAQRQRAWLAVEKEQDARAERRRLLLRRDEYLSAVADAAASIARQIDLLPQDAAAFAAALGVEDLHPVRVALKGLAGRLRTGIAKKLDALALAAPLTDDELPEEPQDGLPGGGAGGP